MSSGMKSVTASGGELAAGGSQLAAGNTAAAILASMLPAAISLRCFSVAE